MEKEVNFYARFEGKHCNSEKECDFFNNTPTEDEPECWRFDELLEEKTLCGAKNSNECEHTDDPECGYECEDSTGIYLRTEECIKEFGE